MRNKWHRIIDKSPPQDTFIQTKVDDHIGARNKTVLKVTGTQWFDNKGNKVGYVPSHRRGIKLIV